MNCSRWPTALPLSVAIRATVWTPVVKLTTENSNDSPPTKRESLHGKTILNSISAMLYLSLKNRSSTEYMYTHTRVCVLFA